VYLTGNISYPGLSDLDIVVVASKARADNAQYFSVAHRLPRVYDPIFLHDAFVVPPEHASIFRYTTHRNLRLVAGKNTLPPVEYVDTPAERWCKLLEGACTYAHFVSSVESSECIRGRRLVAKASSLRYTLREMDALRGSAYAGGYANAIDEIRANYYARDPHVTMPQLWEIFSDGHRTLAQWLSSVVPTQNGETVAQFARRFFIGQRHFEAVPQDYIARRRADLNAYHDALAALKIPYGSIAGGWFRVAQGRSGPIYRQPRLHSGLFRLTYRIGRMVAAG
jgi:hypothetical protein